MQSFCMVDELTWLMKCGMELFGEYIQAIYAYW